MPTHGPHRPASGIAATVVRAAVPILLLVVACARPAGSASATMVFAAASLGAPFEKLAKDFEQSHPGTKLDLHFAGTPQLVVQVREGAAVDVFASADEPSMQKLVDAKRTAAAPARFATNRLAIVVGKGNPKGIATLADLARKDLRVVLCGPEVPAGKYARQALAKAGTTVRSLSDESNVKAVVARVQLGEADAGIVYVTDATAAAANVDAVPIAEAHNVTATYPIAALSVGRNGATGAAFVAYVLSPEGQRVLREFGLQAP